MTEFKIGDIVRLSKGESDKPGYRVEVRTVTEGISESPEVNLSTLRTFENARWTVELIERPLPTRPNTIGWVTVDGTRHLARLGARGLWELYDEDGYFGSAAPPSIIEDFTEAVLLPKRLADKVTEWAGDKVGDWRAGVLLERIANHLKGQDDD